MTTSMSGRPGLALAELRNGHGAFFEQAGCCIQDPERHRRPPERLRFDEDAAKLYGQKPALFMHCAEDLLSVQVTVAEVPAEHEPGDELSVEVLVVLEPGYRPRDQLGQRPSVQVHEAKCHDLADETDGGLAVVQPF